MRKSTQRKSRGQKSTAAGTASIKGQNSTSLDHIDLDRSTILAARKLLKRRLYGHDVPSEFWLHFGLESQKRLLLIYLIVYQLNEDFFV